MVILYVKYICKEGQREAFLNAIKAAGVDEASRAEAGNIRYAYSFDDADKNALILNEAWKDKDAFKSHCKEEHFKKLGGIKDEYVVDAVVEKYEAVAF